MVEKLRLFFGIAASVLVGMCAAAAKPRNVPVFSHVVIIVQENRSPDNIFGSNPTFEPGVDITNVGVNSRGQQVPLTAAPWTQCWDLDHSHNGFEREFSEGFDFEDAKGNGAPTCTIPPNPAFSYLDNSAGQVQPYFDIATNFGFANRMFQTNQGPSFPAHLFLFAGTSAPRTESPLFLAGNMSQNTEASGCIGPAGQSTSVIDGFGVLTNGIYPCAEINTLGDVLTAAGLSWHYYTPSPGSIWNAPAAVYHLCQPAMVRAALSCEGPPFTNGSVITGNPAAFITDVQKCNLASVTWVIPDSKESDHAQQTNGTGPAYVASLINAVGENPACATGETYWQDTAIFVTWDDWGGWYDHVPPFQVNVAPATSPQWGDGFTYGFRVPLLVVSAFTPAGYVDNGIHDFGSILHFVESNFGLPFVGDGRTIYGNYADYQSAQRGDTLTGFFTLSVPRSFTPIAAAQPSSYFLAQPTPTGGPDDE